MKLAAGLLVAMLASTAVSAQESCSQEETLAECWTRVAAAASGLSGPAIDDAKERAIDNDRAEAVEADQPGVNTAGAAQSVVTDLVPWLNMLGLLSDADANDGSIVADLNFLLPGTAVADHNAQLKWQLDVKPEPYEPLIAAFPQGVRGERKGEFAARLNDTADSELQFAWSLVNDRFGRDFRQHRETINAIVEPLYTGARNAVRVAQPGQEFMQAIGPFIADGSLPGVDILNVKVSALTQNRESIVDAVVQGAQRTGEAQKGLIENLQPKLAESGVDRLAELVLQQPQLLVSATRRFRDELVGPDAWGVKVTYEHSFANFGDFLRHASSCDPHAAANRAGINGAACYQSLNQYLDDHAEDLKKGSRWQASLEYRRLDGITYDFPDDGVHLDVPKIDRLIASVGVGRNLPRSTANDHVDFVASYDSNVDNDAGSNSRFVVSLTYTRRIGELDVPFAIVYANKSEFLDEGDHQIGMHVGVRFRAPE